MHLINLLITVPYDYSEMIATEHYIHPHTKVTCLLLNHKENALYRFFIYKSNLDACLTELKSIFYCEYNHAPLH